MNWKKGLHRLFIVLTAMYLIGVGCKMAWELKSSRQSEADTATHRVFYCYDNWSRDPDRARNAAHCVEETKEYQKIWGEVRADTIFTSVQTIEDWIQTPTWKVYLSLPFIFYGLCRAMIFISRWVYAGFRQAA